MKKLIFVLLCMLAVGGFAMAESKYSVAKDVPTAIDLDGNGTMETVEWTMDGQSEYNDANLVVKVTSANGMESVYETFICWGEDVYALDVDFDGLTEILVTGDVASDDYVTYCLRYENGLLYEVLFADANRGENTDGYFKSGYGKITGVGKGTLTLSGSQDVLGTWFGSRKFTLAPYGRFELDDGGWWIRDVNVNDPDVWEYGALTLTQNLDTVLDGKMSTLRAGEKILVTASNKVSQVRFVTRDGRSGTLEIWPNYVSGWGHYVNDIPEEELFEYIPYAD